MYPYSHVKNYFLTFNLDHIQIEQNKQITKISSLEFQWLLSFDIKSNGSQASDPYIIYATHSLSIRFHRHTSKLYICWQTCFLYRIPLPTTYFSNIKIMQTWNVKTLKYVYSIHINGELKYSTINTSPRVYSNVRLYATYSSFQPANATLRNLVFVNIPNG